MGKCADCFIVILILQSALFMAAIGILFIWSGTQIKNNEALEEYDYNIYGFWVGLGLGILMFIISFIGIGLMICKNKCVSCCYFFIAVLGFLIFGACLIVYIVGTSYVDPYIYD